MNSETVLFGTVLFFPKTVSQFFDELGNCAGSHSSFFSETVRARTVFGLPPFGSGLDTLFDPLDKIVEGLLLHSDGFVEILQGPTLYLQGAILHLALGSRTLDLALVLTRFVASAECLMC